MQSMHKHTCKRMEGMTAQGRQKKKKNSGDVVTDEIISSGRW